MKKVGILASTLLITLFTSSIYAAETQPTNPRTFTKQSTDQQAVLVELFTSEGCSSCPPADKWLSKLEQRGYSRHQVIPLSLHVDYWDYIGWKDPFAQAQFGERQRHYVQLNRARTAYTPQIMVNGADLRSKSGFAEYVRGTGQKAAKVKYTVTATLDVNSLNIDIQFDNSTKPDDSVNLIVAITENGLSNKVSRGENTGHTLKHSYVTRVFENLGSMQTQMTVQIALESDWNVDQLSLVAFLQKNNGDVLQALSLPLSSQ